MASLLSSIRPSKGKGRHSLRITEPLAKEICQRVQEVGPTVTRMCDPGHRRLLGNSEKLVIMHSRIRVFSVDDHPLVREGVAMVINSQPDMTMVAQASNGRDAIERFREHKPDVTLMDLSLPDMSGVDALVAIRKESPEARVIIWTTFDSDTESRRALAEGARAYVLKSAPPQDLTETIRQVHIQ